LLLTLMASEASSDDRLTTPRRHPDLELIERYIGKEFSRAFSDEARPLEDALARLIPDRVHNDRPLLLKLRPAFVWRFGPNSEALNCLVLERDRVMSMPSTTQIRLTLLGGDGRLVSEAKFDVGGRNNFLKAACLKSIAGVEFPLVDLEADARSPDRAHLYCTLIDDRFDLIRLEGREGGAGRNHYFANCSCSGPLPPGQTDKQWEADLLSGNRARVLRALVWLGGIHDLRAGNESKGGSAPKVRERPAVTAKLRELAERGEKWEREAAKLALRPEDYR